MEIASPLKDSTSVSSSPFSSPNVGALLKIKIISWYDDFLLILTIFLMF